MNVKLRENFLLLVIGVLSIIGLAVFMAFDISQDNHKSLLYKFLVCVTVLATILIIVYFGSREFIFSRRQHVRLFVSIILCCLRQFIFLIFPISWIAPC